MKGCASSRGIGRAAAIGLCAALLAAVPAGAQVSCPATPATCGYSSNFSRVRLQAGDFLWKFRRGRILAADVGDPQNSTDYAVCIYVDGQFLKEMQLPHGGRCGARSCWAKLQARGWAYYAPDGNDDGLNRIKIKLHESGAIMKVRGRGPKTSFPLPLTVQQAVTMQLHNSGGKCWEAIFPAPPNSQRPDRYADSTYFLTFTPP